MKKKVLAIAPFLLGDKTASGGAAVALTFLKSIASKFDLYVVAFDESPGSAESQDAVKDMLLWAAEVRPVPLTISSLSRFKGRALQALLIPQIVTWLRTSLFENACREILKAQSIDLVIVQFPQMAQYVEECGQVPAIMDTIDVQSVSAFRRFSSAKSLLKRISSGLDWFCWIRYERRYYPRFRHLLSISEQDKYGLTLFNPELKVTTIPRLLNIARVALADPPEFQIGFVGSFTHEPNVIGLKFFLSEVLPLLVAQLPDLRVQIAGKNPPQDLVRQAPACVHFAGFVPNIEDFYRQTMVVVAPLLSGGGVKIKVLEALLAGRPVVATSIGAEGMGLTHGVNILIADNAHSFATAIVTLLTNPALRAELSQAGYQHALATGGAQNHEQLLDGIFDSVLKS